MDGASVSSVFTGTTSSTSASGRSNLTLTTSSGASSVGGAVTMNQSMFARPKHLHLLGNQRNAKGIGHVASEELKDGLANFGHPERERFRTNFQDNYGRAPLSDNVPPEICKKVIKDGQLPLVQRFLEGAHPTQRAQFGNAIRSLQSLRRMGKGNRTQQQDENDLEENTRLWQPAPMDPLPPGICQRSQIPLGGVANTLSEATLKKSALNRQLPALDKVSATLGRPPPSPSVSNLSSLPLSPPGTAGTRNS